MALVLATVTTHSLHAQTGYTVTERGPDWKVLQQTTVEHGTNRIHRYTELATGLNYTNASGQLVESSEQITLLASGGAIANHGRHTVAFPANIFNGVIEVVTPDGRHLKSRPLGISYDDGSNTVFIATLKAAQGYLTSSNTVTYRDAFTGFKADLVCTYRRGGFESDLVFRQQPPTPGDYGLDANFSTLQMVTEFFNTADPEQVPGASDDWFGLQDSTLKFGKLTMTHGKAFGIKAESGNGKAEMNASPVYKSWIKSGGRKFLVESVPVLDIAENLDALPLTAKVESRKQKMENRTLLAAGSRLKSFPPAHSSIADTNQILLAVNDFKSEPGVVLDYNELIEGQSDFTDYTFQSGQTYLVSGAVALNGTATFEGGSVIKFSGGSLNGSSQVAWNTTPESPAIFTSGDDDSVGESVGGYNAGDTYLNFSFGDSFTIWCARFYNAGTAVQFGWQFPVNVYHSQFINCGVGVYTAWGLDDQVNFYNVLGASDGYLAASAGNISVNCQNVTMTHYTLPIGFGNNWSGCAGYSSLNLQNTIWLNPGNCAPIGSVTFDHTYVDEMTYDSIGYPTILDGSIPVFQSVPADTFYLNNALRYSGSVFVNGAPNNSIITLTTYAPQDGGWPDTNGTDLGYHYPVNEDSDHDGLPDWWEWHWFHNFNHYGSQLDASGNTILSDYQDYANHTATNDPNVIVFSIGATNDYVNHTNVSVQLEITAGEPGYYAVFVNSTTTTNWLTFTGTNLTINLGTTDGVYNVVVGLKGFAAEATETWRDYAFYLDRKPPTLSITNPISSAATVMKPYLQLQGFASEPLASVSYDITNGFGLFTNQDAFVIAQCFDTNTFDFTTNFFQAYDVTLATNENVITVRVTDRAGNTATTNFTVVLDYATATNLPVVKLIWPLDGMSVSGSNCTIRGTMSDETGGIVATVVNGDGATNVFEGLVERNNNFWIENVPLNGTNWISIQATDAAGNVATTNFTVKPSSFQLQVTHTPTGDDLYKGYGTVSGTVSDPGAAVTVNGVAATVSGTAWTAANVPVLGKGTATFTAQAASSASGTSQSSVDVEFGARLELFKYHLHTYVNVDDGSLWPFGDEWTKDLTDTLERGHTDWKKKRQGTANDRSWDDDDTLHNPSLHQDTSWETVVKTQYEWTGTSEWTETRSYLNNVLTGPTRVETVADWVKDAPEDWIWGPEYYADGKYCHWFLLYQGGGSTEVELDARTELMLYTGGKATVSRKNLFCIYRSRGTEYKGTPWTHYGKNIPPEQMKAFGKNFGTDGKLWKVFPDNAALPAGLIAPGKKHYNAEAAQAKYHLVSRCRCPRQDFARTTVGVGEVVDVYFSSTGSDKILSPQAVALPLPATDPIHWTTTGGYLSAAYSFSGTVLTSPYSASAATVTATVKGEKLSISFTAIEPSGIKAKKRSDDSYFVGTVGAGMEIDVTLLPETVSFNRVQIKEPGAVATGKIGYFASTSASHVPPNHDSAHGANKWHGVNCDNLVVDDHFDHAWSSGWIGPFGQGGSYTWPISPIWSVGGDDNHTHPLNGWTDQVMKLSSDGTMRVDKLGCDSSRPPYPPSP